MCIYTYIYTHTRHLALRRAWGVSSLSKHPALVRGLSYAYCEAV